MMTAWGLFGAVHSITASQRWQSWLFKQWPALAPVYRILFNIVALITVIPPLAIMAVYDGQPLWQWSGPWRWLAWLLASLAILGFLWSLKFYDLKEFLGIRQMQRTTDEQGVFVISPLHRFVRHPWYCFALILIWTRDMDTVFLSAALAITAYFAIGTYYEERKLEQRFGDVYRRYKHHVPAFLPLPWKQLSRAQAAGLMKR